MPTFYFDVREGTTFVTDHEGIQLPDLDAAEREAMEAAVEIARDRLPKRDAREVSVLVRNEDGERAMTVTVSMSVQRSGSPPSAAG